MRTTAGIFLVSCAACVSPDGGPKQEAAAAAGKDAIGGPEPSPAPTPSTLLVGRWRMISEEAPPGQEGVSQQGRKLLELRADGTFASENYIEGLEGAWKLEGEALVLGDRRPQLVDVDAQRLVLIEDVPKGYLRDGPAQKVRMTYRRVSEAELGPMMGREVELSTPEAGIYAGDYAYRMAKYPTTEMYVGRTVDGRARIELGADGTSTGCFGIWSSKHSSISKYASRDGEHHSQQDERRTLIGWTGTWVIGNDAARVTAERTWSDRCEDTGGDGGSMGRIELQCQAVATNEAIPAKALACRVVEGPSTLEDIALNPSDTERSGPYTMQSDPMRHISTDPGRPWLILGTAPGLKVDADDGRDVPSPVVKFEVASVDFVEGNYRPRPP